MASKTSQARKRRATAQSPGSRTPRGGKATEQRILSAALEVFKKKGFERTTTRDIARRARVSEATFKRFFRAKDDVAVLFFRSCVRNAVRSVEKNRRLRAAATKEKLFALISRQLDYLSPHQKFVRDVLGEVWRPDSKLSPLSLDSLKLQVEYLSEVAALLDQAERKHELPRLGVIGPSAFAVYYAAILGYWMYDTSEGKESTLAVLDRSLNLVFRLLGGFATSG